MSATSAHNRSPPPPTIIRTSRLLSVTNAYQLLVTGATAHRYSRIFGSFRLSNWALVNLALIHSLYWWCLITHYRHSDELRVLKFLSRLLHDCIYAHLFVGVFTYVVVACEYRQYLAFSERVCTTVNANVGFKQRQRDLALPPPVERSIAAEDAQWWQRLADDCRIRALRCGRLEWFVYYKMWTNTVVLVTLVVYTLCRMDLERLTLTQVLLIVGLAYPHLLVANVLRYYTVHSMVVNAMWQDENGQLAVMAAERVGTGRERELTKPVTITLDAFATEPPAAPTAAAVDTELRQHLANIDRYRQLYAELNRLVQFQLGLLLKKNSLIVFIVVHVYVKVRLLWHTVLTEMDEHLMRVNFVTFVVMMLNDYVCVLVVSQVCQKEINRTKSLLLDWLDSARHEQTLRTVWNYVLRFRDYRYGGLRLFMLFRINGRNFVMMLVLQLMCTAIVGAYQYFETKIDEE